MVSKVFLKKTGKIFLFLLLNLCFTAAIIWVAYNNRTRIKRFLDHENSFTPEDKVALYDLFTSPLVNGKDLLHKPITSSEDLKKLIYSQTLPDTLDPIRMFENCEVLSSGKFRENMFRVRYRLYNDTLDAYAYVNKPGEPGKKTAKTILYLAGSGDNRPGKVAGRNLAVEDPTVQAQQIGADIYFPLFPADDILAIHDGTKMMDIKKSIGYLVSINRNLSLRYLADIFAIKKYLDSQYSILHVWGHSRGGSTATVVSSVFFPDMLIVSSGYSVANDKYFRLNADQLYWSRASVYSDKNFVKSRLCNSKTSVYFLYGNKESDDVYGLEGKHFYTEHFFKGCTNIKARYVDKRHEWFGDEISKILSGE